MRLAPFVSLGLLLPFGGLFALGACVGDSPVNPTDGGSDTSSGGDVATDNNVVTDTGGNDVVDSGPPPCGAPGETCCSAPLAPCQDGLTCSTNNTKCMVSEAWALGEYSTVTSSNFITEFVTAHYDGATWTLGQPVKVLTGLSPGYATDIYEVGTNVRVLTNENDVGYMYWWNGVSWAQCKTGNSCVGPTTTADLWAVTSVVNNGSLEFWLAGTNTMYRCASGASSCTSVTNGITGSWGTGTFAGQTAQDLWYSVFDHVLHYDGSQWSSMTVADARAMTDVGTNDIWLGDQQLRHWDGQAWSSAYLVDGAKTPGLIFSLSGSGTNDVFAVGNTNGTGSFAAHWDGTGWKMTTLPSISGVQKVWAPSPIEAFVVGAKATSSNAGVIAHWDGTKWTEMPSPTVTYSGETQQGGMKWISVWGQARPRRK